MKTKEGRINYFLLFFGILLIIVLGLAVHLITGDPMRAIGYIFITFPFILKMSIR